MEAAARYSGERMDEIARHTEALLEGLQSIVSETAALTKSLAEHKEISTQDQWVETWGETVNKKTAAEMLGVSPSQITKMVSAGVLKVTPDGRVLVRQAATWANSGRKVAENKQTETRTRRNTKPFIP